MVLTNPNGTASNQQTLTVAAGARDFVYQSRQRNCRQRGVHPDRGRQWIRARRGGGIEWRRADHHLCEFHGSIGAGAGRASGCGGATKRNRGGRRTAAASVQPVALTVVSTPVINSLEPAAAIAGSAALTLAILGSGFVSGAVAKLNGTALPTASVSASELTAQITAAQIANAGQLSITVGNPAGPASNAQNLAVDAAPAISAIHPASVAADSSAFTLIVDGGGFASGATVELNGTALTTTFVSSTELDAHVPRSGYTTGSDGTFVLFFDNIIGRSQAVTLIVTHPSFPQPKLVNVTVLRGATVSVDIDMSS